MWLSMRTLGGMGVAASLHSTTFPWKTLFLSYTEANGVPCGYHQKLLGRENNLND